MSQAPLAVRLDFVAPPSEARLAGALLCFAGLAATVSLAVAFSSALTERGQLDAALGAAARPRHRPPAPEALKTSQEFAAIDRELNVPWTKLLAELEAASLDNASSVALLHVEPDPIKRTVRISAEVRALPDAFAYLKRLQKSAVLRYPMLESHERHKDDATPSLGIKLSAEWVP